MLNCENCAQLLRLYTCKGNKKQCSSFIDNRAGCRRCLHVKACHTLGKKIGIYHVCVNFEKQLDSAKLPDYSRFPDYDLYLQKQEEVKVKKVKDKKVKLEKKPIKLKNLDKEASKLLSAYEDERLLEADKNALGANFDSEKQPNDWSPEALVSRIINSEYDPRVFELINEQDIPKSTNPVQFIIDPKFMGINLFPRQLQISLDYFGAYCTKCSDLKFIRNKIKVNTPVDEILDRTVFYVNGKCPKCGQSRYEAIVKHEHNNYNTLVGLAGQRSGKSIFHGILAACILQQYLCLPNPVTFMKQLNSVTFTMTFVGLRFQDAYDNLWRDFYANITNSPWFTMYNNFLRDEGIRLGTELIKLKDTFAVYTNKRISIVPAGPDKRKLRGRCITGNTLITTTTGSINASDAKHLINGKVIDRGNEFKITGYEKQQLKKEVVKCYFGNGITLQVTTDHRIPCYNEGLIEAENILDKYVMCQLDTRFSEKFNLNILKSTRENILSYIRLRRVSPNKFKDSSFILQQAILKFCNCFRFKSHIYVTNYDANILNKHLGFPPVEFSQEDCSAYLIPGTNVYTKSELNKLYNIEVPEQYLQYIDKNIIFVKCTKQVNIGFKTVYDIEVDSPEHLFAANSILVHNTRIFESMDEVGWFTGKDGSITLDADEVAIALENSLKTVRNESEKLVELYPDVPNAHAIYISSPRSKLDKIMRLYKQSKVIDSMYGFKLPTWEFNPNFTRASFKDDYAKDAVAAEANFGANPPFGENLYIRSPASIISVLSNKRNVLEVANYKLHKDSLGAYLRYPIIKTKPHQIPSCLAIDCGYNDNSFAISILHFINRYNEETEEFIKIPACSGIIEIQPEEGIALSFNKIYETVISKIIEAFNIQLVCFDRWQSIDLRQRIFDDFGIDTIQYSVNMQDFTDLKTNILSENFILPKCEQDIKNIVSLDTELAVLTKDKPVSHLIIQLITSKDNGRIITKGDETSDDILRSVCLGHAILIDEDYAEFFDTDAGDSELNDKIGTIGVISSGSSTGKNDSGARIISGIGCMA